MVVEEGLQEGDSLVAEGIQNIHPGSIVVVKESGDSGAGQP